MSTIGICNAIFISNSIFDTRYHKKSKIRQLESFCYVVESDVSLVKASERANISSSSISMYIKSLEYELGYSLFDRDGKKMSLNKKGQEYYKQVKKILIDLDNLVKGNL